jgi:hypothetical protein
MNGIPNPAAVQMARRIEALMDDARPAAGSDPALALASLMLALHDVVDELDAIPAVPPIRGGAPHDDDFEELCPESLSDPSWPAYRDDATADYAGPTPLSVLQAQAPEWEPTAEDLAEMASWSAGLFTEADALVSFGAV